MEIYSCHLTRMIIIITTIIIINFVHWVQNAKQE